MTTEVQSHVILLERELCVNVNGATKEELKGLNYTNKTDLPGKFNRLDENCDLSIKTTGYLNAVGMADCLRVYDAVSDGETPLHLTVIHYTQCDETHCKMVHSDDSSVRSINSNSFYKNIRREYSNAFRGGVISSQIVSRRRKFNKKITVTPPPSSLPPVLPPVLPLESSDSAPHSLLILKDFEVQLYYSEMYVCLFFL